MDLISIRYTSIIKALLVLFLFTFTSHILSKNILDENFSYLDRKDGLPNSYIISALQDYKGYLWFGTEEGLCKYNGYEFVTYRSDDGKDNGLRYHQITCLYEAPDSTLWLGVWSDGLYRYDRENDKFVLVKTHSEEKLINRYIRDIYKDSYENIWVSYTGELCRVDSTGYKHIFPENETEFSASAVVQLDDNSLLVAAQEHLYLYDYNNNKLSLFNSPAYGNINHIFEYDDQTLWLCARHGIFTLNKKSKKIQPLYLGLDNQQDLNIQFAIRSRMGDVWLGGKQLIKYSEIKAGLDFTPKVEIFSGNSFTCGASGSQNKLWFGTFNSGICIYSETTFQTIKHAKINNYLQETSSRVEGLSIDDSGIWTVGTWNNGLLAFDKNQKPVSIGSLFKNAEKLEDISILSITEGKNGDIWVGGGYSTLARIETKAKKVHYYEIDNYKFLAERVVSDIELGNDDQVWFSSTNEIFSMAPETEKITQYQPQFIPSIVNIEQTRKGEVYVLSSLNGLYKKNENNYFEHISNTRYPNLPEYRYKTLFVDSKDKLWVGTEFNGLFCYESETDSFIQYSTEQGFPSNNILSIEEDNDNNLWLTSKLGISKLNHSSGEISNHTLSDMLNNSEFLDNSSYKTEDGQIIFGKIDGIVAFDPNVVKNFKTQLPLYIENVAVNNGAVTHDNNNTIIKSAILNGTPIELKYNENTISIDYSTLNYSRIRKSQYAYKLIGLDNDFQHVGELNQVTYTKLPPGKYTFKVIATNNENIWSEDSAEFSFIIKRPPWLSWWAYTLYVLIILAITYLSRLFILHEQKMKNALALERLKKEQNEKLTQLKVNFFTNISHEFKTPLTLIISPIREIMADHHLHGNSGIKKKLNKIHNNSNRLLNLVNQLIDFRRMEQDILPLYKENADIVQSVAYTVELFSDFAKQKGINLQFKSEMNTCVAYFDKDKIEKIVNNIIHNALKYTNKGGQVFTYLKIENTNIKIIIRDTGSGMTSETISKITARFVRGSGTEHIDGSGIGIAYAKRLIEIHGGSFEINSEEGVGTEALLTFPFEEPNSQLQEHTIMGRPQGLQGHSILPLSDSHTPFEQKTSFKENTPHLLIVEDDDELRDYLSSLLQENYNVHSAINGREGLKMANDNDYDLIISDVMMPEMNGIELCRKLKSNINTCHISIILLTAKSDIESQLEGYKTGADNYVSKPFVPESLFAIINNTLTIRQNIKKRNASLETTDSEEVNDTPIAMHPRDKEFIEKVTYIISENLANKDYGVVSLSREMGLSQSSLYKKFKALIGISYKEYTQKIRFNKAVEFLKQDELSISEIAYKLGFSSQSNFSTAFKKHVGNTPKEYKEKNR
ncbi:hybrid sensor histidine kinase/response regulator transcription factor [Carboxylicivirga sp. RSCT41]|uniref:hybrid sensor histidine kinase/response regulator transcription factor n=1 Tax=Carboxylicivirga agarovorans TaxID=3417570 RepID=UPI003D33FE32